MIKLRCKHFLLAIILCTFLVPTGTVTGAETLTDFDYNRARLLSYVLRQQLTMNHYSHKKINDDLSLAAFDLYLKQLDSQKRFFLKGDVDRLRVYAAEIDDEMKSGKIELPVVAANILEKRINNASKIVKQIIDKGFDFSIKESLETDADKLDFCKTPAELRERWRKTIKYQTINRYLNLLEDENSDPENSPTKAEPDETTILKLRQKAREKILKSYEDFFDRLLKDKLRDYFDRYFNAFARAFDPHTNYLPPSQKEDFDISMRGSLEGIGALLQEEDGYIKVKRIIPGSAASRQGQLQGEDIILAVAEGNGEPVDITDTRIRDAVSYIRGEKGTEVRLTVKKPDGTRTIIPIIRDIVQLEETFVKSIPLTDKKTGEKFGYMKIPSFYRDFEKSENGDGGRNVTDDVYLALEKLQTQKIDGLILDLRNNGGGALVDAVRISGLFISTGPVVQVKNSTGRTKILQDDDPKIEFNGPMVVLVNKFSASASEILAGMLQDYGRAIIVGSAHTHGKGTVQTLIDLDQTVIFGNMEKYKPLGALRLTIQKFYRVSGESTQYRGVVPDIEFPDRLKYLKSGEQYIDYSLPWDTISPTTYTKWSDKISDLALIEQKSRQRIQSNDDFIHIAEASDRTREKMDKTVRSLLIDDLKKERQEAKLLGEGEMARQPHPDIENKTPDKEAFSKEDKDKLLLAEVSEDPYVGEALALMDDVILARAGNTAENNAGKAGETRLSKPAIKKRHASDNI